MKEPSPLIIKITVSEDRRTVSAHNEANTISFNGPIAPETLVLMGKRKVAFFHAKVNELRQLAIQQEAGWQDW